LFTFKDAFYIIQLEGYASKETVLKLTFHSKFFLTSLCASKNLESTNHLPQNLCHFGKSWKHVSKHYKNHWDKYFPVCITFILS